MFSAYWIRRKKAAKKISIPLNRKEISWAKQITYSDHSPSGDPARCQHKLAEAVKVTLGSQGTPSVVLKRKFGGPHHHSKTRKNGGERDRSSKIHWKIWAPRWCAKFAHRRPPTSPGDGTHHASYPAPGDPTVRRQKP